MYGDVRWMYGVRWPRVMYDDLGWCTMTYGDVLLCTVIWMLCQTWGRLHKSRTPGTWHLRQTLGRAFILRQLHHSQALWTPDAAQAWNQRLMGRWRRAVVRPAIMTCVINFKMARMLLLKIDVLFGGSRILERRGQLRSIWLVVCHRALRR